MRAARNAREIKAAIALSLLREIASSIVHISEVGNSLSTLRFQNIGEHNPSAIVFGRNGSNLTVDLSKPHCRYRSNAILLAPSWAALYPFLLLFQFMELYTPVDTPPIEQATFTPMVQP